MKKSEKNERHCPPNAAPRKWQPKAAKQPPPSRPTRTPGASRNPRTQPNNSRPKKRQKIMGRQPYQKGSDPAQGRPVCGVLAACEALAPWCFGRLSLRQGTGGEATRRTGGDGEGEGAAECRRARAICPPLSRPAGAGFLVFLRRVRPFPFPAWGFAEAGEGVR